MNELRVPDLFDLDPFPATLRDLWRPWRNEAATERAPQIRIDLSETDNAFAIKAEIPGVKKEDIDVRIDGNQVTISAEVKQDSEEKKDGRVLRSVPGEWLLPYLHQRYDDPGAQGIDVALRAGA